MPVPARRVIERGEVAGFTGVTGATDMEDLGDGRLASAVVTGRSANNRRGVLLELGVLVVLLALVLPPILLAAQRQATTQQAVATLSVTSDPPDASVIVDDLWLGRTPLQLQLERGQEVALRVEAREPYLEYNLYRPYRTTLELSENRNLHVWIPRTTAEEQEAQRSSRR